MSDIYELIDQDGDFDVIHNAQVKASGGVEYFTGTCDGQVVFGLKVERRATACPVYLNPNDATLAAAERLVELIKENM